MANKDTARDHWTLADVKLRLADVTTIVGLCALNDVIESRFHKDEQEITMSDADWNEWSLLMSEKAANLR